MRLDMLRAASNYRIPLSCTAALLISAFIVMGLSLLQGYPAIPPPGLAIGLLGAGAVIVAVRTDHLTLWEKIGWVCVAFLLFAVEIKAIYHDRDEHDKEVQAAQERGEKNFREIAGGIAQAIHQSQQNFDAVMSSTNNLLEFNLGGDSICFMMLEPGVLAWKSQAVPMFTHKGKYPLYGVKANVEDLVIMKQLMGNLGRGMGIIIAAALPAQKIIDVGDIIPGTSSVMWNSAIPLQDHRELVLHIIFMARNGSWHEDLRVLFVKDKWTQAVRVYRMKGNKRGPDLFAYADQDYPRNKHGQVDWNAMPPATNPQPKP